VVAWLLGIAWFVGSALAFMLGFGLVADSMPVRAAADRFADAGPCLVGTGALVLALLAGAQISNLRERRTHPGRRVTGLALTRYYTIPQALRHNTKVMAVPVLMIAVGLLIAYRRS
jgi:hypothetical protein